MQVNVPSSLWETVKGPVWLEQGSKEMSLEGVSQIDESDHLLLASGALVLLWNLVSPCCTVFPASLLTSQGTTTFPKWDD